MAFLDTYESFRLITQHIENCDRTEDYKRDAIEKLRDIFKKIIFALCTVSDTGIVKSSTQKNVDQSRSSPNFNSLTFVVHEVNNGKVSHKTFSFYSGLKKFSSPNYLFATLGFDLGFLKNFGVNQSLSIFCPLDTARLCYMQRRESVPAAVDIHFGLSFGHFIGEYPATFDGDIISIFNLISHHFHFSTISPLNCESSLLICLIRKKRKFVKTFLYAYTPCHISVTIGPYP